MRKFIVQFFHKTKLEAEVEKETETEVMALSMAMLDIYNQVSVSSWVKSPDRTIVIKTE